MIRKMFKFVAICLWAIGAVGGVVYGGTSGDWLTVAGALVCGWMGWPRVTGYANEIIFWKS